MTMTPEEKREINKIRSREYYYRNREKISEQYKLQWAAKTKEERQAISEKNKPYIKEYYEKNKARINAQKEARARGVKKWKERKRNQELETQLNIEGDSNDRITTDNV